MAKKYKWAIDKETVTLAEVENIPAFIEEWGWLKNEDIEAALKRAASRFLNCSTCMIDVISCGRVEIACHRYRLTLYANNAVVKYWDKGDKFAVLYTDIIDAIQEAETLSAYLQTFDKVFDNCVTG